MFTQIRSQQNITVLSIIQSGNDLIDPYMCSAKVVNLPFFMKIQSIKCIIIIDTEVYNRNKIRAGTRLLFTRALNIFKSIIFRACVLKLQCVSS